MPKRHIPYVDSRLSKEQLQQYHLGEFERRYEIDGEEFSIYIMDFRSETEHGKAQDYPIDFYTMGFMETDPVKPNELSAAIIEQAKERNSVLIVPRFENLPHNPGSDVEAQLVLRALELESKHGNKEIDFNLATHDVKIIGFSDGARTAVELAGLVNQIPPENDNIKRTLRSISPTAVIDIIDEGKKADGTTMFKGFTEQVTWITLEEMRMRLNAQLDEEAQRLNENVHEKMASGEISIPESEFAKAVQHELRSRDESGKSNYPLLKKISKE
ncbi:hypothetical protein A2X44_00100 [candidate division CPR3 bacterium GWF2_35_18]|uniref:Uncharacterized protein n=1 Tax=candidate division CPR3 bacterium GW2011_GWF2_35_18 TaxID=1618350 RepID=A0A0G0BL22_UNCC3|nr:MAG: hypothetical protein UR67_C0001G0017 [candidate division CPR3 bacterium GW2011_GWF2_35_18]KKP85629.1 MAG: hypothetical protein UR87_C0042G0003 [candidate division CPR3 bacterium GW2011_GWE2_35_7]OGB63325.1 MAG: hypothetical protein A2X44_00100 [candidate division CPR3 bacterium GWF2_35_18]OGB65606.1 MAG: hypothetical protein A2250_02410 [candidate division CPR3 bacterium RIFOXYA2_FULL_35_13]OGB79587.1 MAG: hypothetical protein A2296_03155 [candidate division CPR3 bacterium RIFOXYB2_FULL